MSPLRYEVSGFSVESALRLAGLAAADGSASSVFRLAEMDPSDRGVRPEWPREPKSPRDQIRRADSSPGCFWLRMADGRILRLDPSKGLMEVEAGTSPGLALTHGVVDFALPSLLSCGDGVVLHGALLETEEGCVAALGESGVGKSTLAARWVRTGRRFLSDDWFVLRSEGGRFLAFPSHPSIRLRERDAALERLGESEEVDSRLEFWKFWYSFGPESGAFCSRPRELRKVVFLSRTGSRSGRTASAPVGSREAMARLLSSLILLELDSNLRWNFLLPFFARLEAEVRMEELRIPEGTEHLADVVEALEGAHAHGR